MAGVTGISKGSAGFMRYQTKYKTNLDFDYVVAFDAIFNISTS